MDYRIWAFPVLSLLGFLIYDWNLQELNRLLGAKPFDLGLLDVMLLAVWSTLAATIFPKELKRPSDLFLIFYVPVCFLWGSSYWKATGLLNVGQAIILMVLLYLPALVITLSSRLALPAAGRLVPSFPLFEGRRLALPLIALLLVASVTALVIVGAHGDFSLNTAYDRRLEGRTALAGHRAAGYLLNMAANGVAPLLGFMAGWRRSPTLFLVAAAYVTLLFWLLGIKFPIMGLVAMTGVGILFGMATVRRHIPRIVMAGFIAMYVFALLEIWFQGSSNVASYVIRRISLVQPQVQSWYLDKWLELDVTARLFGIPLGAYSDVTYLIGDQYFHNPDSNANVDAFLLALLKYGFVGYVLAIAVVTGFTLITDALYERTRMPEFVALAGLYGMLVSEQAFTTALVSSGIFLCFGLVFLFSRPKPGEQQVSMEV
jgi:hypothetical protein